MAISNSPVIHSTSLLSRLPIFYPITSRLRQERIEEKDGSVTIKRELKEWTSKSGHGQLVTTSAMTLLHKRFLMSLIRNVRAKKLRKGGEIVICVCMSEVLKSADITTRHRQPKIGFDLLNDMRFSDFSFFDVDADIQKDAPKGSMSFINHWYIADGNNGRQEVVFDIDTGNLGNIKKMEGLTEKQEFGVIIEFSPAFSHLFTTEFLTMAHSEQSKAIQKIRSGFLYAIVDNLLSHSIKKGESITRKLETVAGEVEVETCEFNHQSKQALLKALNNEKNKKILDIAGITFDFETEVFTRYHVDDIKNMRIKSLKEQEQMGLWG